MATDKAIGNKIRKLHHEGTPQRQAVAEAINMKKEGRLAKEGGYKRKSPHRA